MSGARAANGNGFDVTRAWAKAKKKLESMTREERVATLVGGDFDEVGGGGEAVPEGDQG